MNRLQLAGVSKRYGDVAALHMVDLTVAPGEALAVVGPNGAGKTTLLSIAAGLVRPDAGELRVRGRIGLVGQDVGVYPTLTVAQNLTFWATLAGLRGTELRRGVAGLASDLGLADLLGRRVGTLAGGQQRRVHVGCGIVGRPELALLDEPTAGGDPTTRAVVLRVVRRLARDGAAVVYATHQLPEVAALDGAAVLSAGRVVARLTGPVDEIGLQAVLDDAAQ